MIGNGFSDSVWIIFCIFVVMHITLEMPYGAVKVTSNNNIAIKLILEVGSCLENFVDEVLFHGC